MVDIVGFKTSTGASGTVKSASNITFNFDVEFVDLAMILDPPDIATRVRGWFANFPFFNGYHLSNQYNLRVNLNEGESTAVNIQSGTSRDVNNLLNGQFITLDTSFPITLTRETFVPEDSDSDPVIDSDFFPPAGDIVFGVDSSGSISFGQRIALANWQIGQDSSTGEFHITYMPDDRNVLQLQPKGVLDVDSAITGGEF